MKRILALLLAVIVVCSAIPAAAQGLSEDIVILYTNDVHTYIDGGLSYDVAAAIKETLQKQYRYVILADAGDHIQGTAYGSNDKGKSIIKMMNAAKYDVAILGNHEFDYGMQVCLSSVDAADFPYVSANFYHERDGIRGENVLDSTVTFDCGGEKLAFVGITTPETFEKSTSAYFQDENGKFIYGISGGEDGCDMVHDVQSAVDEAKKSGATKIIALGHLGVDMSSSPWTSRETIAAISGIDAFIDGHSHTVIDGEKVMDKDGHEVLLTQTGSYFDRIGVMIIDSETSEISTDFIEYKEVFGDDGKNVIDTKIVSDILGESDVLSLATVKEMKDRLISEVDKKLGDVIGSAEVILDNYDSAGERLVRSSETNTGDFVTDALYYLFDNMNLDVDVAIMNGGGIRNNTVSGDVSYKICKDIHTFGNVACLQTVTGQQILDALEWGARKIGVGENGGFLQASGITYKVNTAIENTVKENEMGTWIGAPDDYRVYDVKVYNKKTNVYEALRLDGKYNLAGYNYTLRNLGDGYAMFDGAVNVLDYVMEDYMVLANYISGFENGIVGADNSPLLNKYPGLLIDYNDVNGSGRIGIDEDMVGVIPLFSDVNTSDWFYDDVNYVTENGLFSGTGENTFSPSEKLNRAMLVTILYRAEGEPKTEKVSPFSDVNKNDYFASAVLWAKKYGIVSGITENEFAPNGQITREQTAAIIYRYALMKGYEAKTGEGLSLYDDFESVSDYAAEAMEYAVLSGVINGKTATSINPGDYVSRAEAAAMIHRFAEATK